MIRCHYFPQLKSELLNVSVVVQALKTIPVKDVKKVLHQHKMSVKYMKLY